MLKLLQNMELYCSLLILLQKGLSTVNLGDDGSLKLEADDTLLIHKGKSLTLECCDQSFLVSVAMESPNQTE